MVHDIEAQYTKMNNAGHSPTEISHRDIHVTFEVREPAGNTIKFFDSHVIGSV